MNTAKNVIPTALVYSKSELEDWVGKLKPYFKVIHLDVVDASVGKETYFDEVESFGAVKSFDRVLVHLMISDPVLYLKNKSGVLKKDNVTYVFKYAKIEDISHVKSLVSLGFKVGISFEIGDSFEINPEILSLVNEVMFVAVMPGKSGRDFDINMLNGLDNFYNKHKLDVFENLKVSVDGGLKVSNLQAYNKCMASVIYANSFFKTNGIEDAIKLLSSYKEEI